MKMCGKVLPPYYTLGWELTETLKNTILAN